MNRLADANSPYLLQHAGNPVDWWPWSDAAFQEAQRRDVPVFLSIGYATCHWCHVMEHESFEDPVTAGLLNDAFVCVKVDREERPDVDGVYMAAVLAATGRGGWPLTALVTPDAREPFWVGTYLPRESRGGRVGVRDLAANVSRFWTDDAEGVRRSAENLAGAVRQLAQASPGDALGREDLGAAVEALVRRFDTQHGGFGMAPKFPTPHHALFLLRRGAQTGDSELSELAVTTLRAIRAGGIWDHVGGGLHRYSTDRQWLVPHFEKMLYDQALYALACTEAAHATGAEDLADAACETLDYVLRDLGAPTGALHSAEDADSLDADGHREEGAFYVWTPAQLADVLGEADAAFASDVWGVTGEGNYRDEATQRRTGASILHLAGPDLSGGPLDAVAARLGSTPEAVRQRLGTIRPQLLAARAQRPRPLLDDKVLADWNGLAIAALAVAGRTLDRPDYTDAGTRAARFVLSSMRTASGDLLHRWRDGQVGIDGMLDDYAFTVWGLAELYQTTFDAGWLGAALDLHDRMSQRFARDEGGWFVSSEDARDLLVRQQNLDDGAMPSGNSVATMNGLRLARLTGRTDLEDQARAALAAPDVVREHPSGFTHLMTAAAFALGPSQEVVVADGEGRAEMVSALRSVYAPFAVTALRSPGTGSARLAELATFTAGQTALDGRATAYVCQNHACQAPTTDPETARQSLAAAVREARGD